MQNAFAACLELQMLNEDDFCDKHARIISINEERNRQLDATANTR